MKKAEDKITTNYYKIIKILYENKEVNSDGIFICKIKQKEIADILNVNKMTVHSIFKELLEDGLIEHYKNHRGLYVLTSRAIDIVKCIEQIYERN